MANNEPQNESFMMKLATFIVDKRNLFFLLVVISVIFTMFSRNWVEVENDMAFYLPPESETRQGLDVMEDQFTTFGTARVMVANVTLDTARTLETQLSKLEGVPDEKRTARFVCAVCYIDEKGDSFTFSVKGSGHGVGMSQYGAGQMAENGADYREILSYYYTGAEIVDLN